MGADLRNNGLFIQTGDPETVSESSTDTFIGGQIGHVMALTNVDSPKIPRLFQYIYRSSGDAATIAAGGVAMWKDYDDFVVTGEPSDAFDGAGLNHVAGVFVSSTAPAITRYGYVQVGGIAEIAYADSSSVGNSPTSTGLPVYAVADGTSAAFGGVAQDWSNAATASTSGAVSVAFPAKPFAKCIETVATVATAGDAVGDAILLVDRVGW
jgi:hypothetical protein